MVKIICLNCGVISDGVYKKFLKETQKELKEVKIKLDNKFEEFETLRLNLKKRGYFKWLFGNVEEIAKENFIKNGDFDTWLFCVDRDLWEAKIIWNVPFKKTKFFTCKNCKENKFI